MNPTNYFYIGLSGIGVVIVASAIAFFTSVIKLPLRNKEQISVLENEVEHIIEQMKLEQESNKNNYNKIEKKLDKINDKLDKFLLSKMEKK